MYENRKIYVNLYRCPLRPAKGKAKWAARHIGKFKHSLLFRVQPRKPRKLFWNNKHEVICDRWTVLGGICSIILVNAHAKRGAFLWLTEVPFPRLHLLLNAIRSITLSLCPYCVMAWLIVGCRQTTINYEISKKNLFLWIGFIAKFLFWTRSKFLCWRRKRIYLHWAIRRKIP